MMEEGASLQAQFYEDALDLLSDAESIVLGLESGGYDEEELNGLFRLFHTLKGNANMVGLEPLGTLCHALESKLDGVRKGAAELDAVLLQQTLEVIDLIENASSRQSLEPFQARIEELKGRLQVEEEIALPRPPAPSVPSAPEKTAPSVRPAGGPVKPDRKMAAYIVVLSKVLAASERMAAESVGEDFPDLLMDLGMDVIDLRSAVDPGRYPSIARRLTYLEKFVTALLRLQAGYDAATFELLFILLDEVRELTEGELRSAPWLRRETVDEPIQFRELVERETASDSPDILAVELRISEEALYRIDDVFNQCRKLREQRRAPVFFYHPNPGKLKKSSLLLGESLGAVYPDIHTDLLHGMFEIAGSVTAQ